MNTRITANVKKVTLGLTAALLIAGAPLQAQTGAAPWSIAKVDSALRRAREAWGIPGMAVAIVRHDSVLLARGYGVRELGKPELVDEHTLFDAASLTKSFTSAAVAALVDEGKVGWDDPVRRHLPQLDFSSPTSAFDVTLRDLLSHRTALEPANAAWYFTNIDRSDLVRRARYLKQRAPFRTALVYSNVGYTLAGEAAASASGVSYEELIRTRLLVPLGMTRTIANYTAAGSASNVAAPHAVVESVHVAIAREGKGRNTTAPAGAIQSSAADLAKWLRFQLAGGTIDGKRIVSEAALRETQSAQVIVPTTAAFRRARGLKYGASYGMGWQVWDSRGRPSLWHTGSGDGQLAYMVIYPEDSLGVVVLLNSWVLTSVPPVHGAIAGCISEALLGSGPPNCEGDAKNMRATDLARRAEAERAFAARRIAGTTPSRPLAAYVGEYTDSLNGPISVRMEGGKLVMQMGPQGEIADLSHWHLDTFIAEWRNAFQRMYFSAAVTFRLNADGFVDELTARLRNDNVRATRVPPPAR
jgi:CubicO group peptidase (beta-lactamase class C family)